MDCTCPHYIDRLRADLEGIEIPPCPTHDRRAHLEQQMSDERRALDDDIDPLEQALTDVTHLRTTPHGSMPLNSSADTFAQVIGLPNAGNGVWDGPDAA